MATRPTDHDPDHYDLGAAWAFLWILFVFKMATVGLIFWHMQTFETGMLLAATTWFWIPVVGVLIAGPLLFRYRLLRVRAKRERLRRAEWMLEHEKSSQRAEGRGQRASEIVLPSDY